MNYSAFDCPHIEKTPFDDKYDRCTYCHQKVCKHPIEYREEKKQFLHLKFPSITHDPSSSDKFIICNLCHKIIQMLPQERKPHVPSGLPR